MNNVNLFQTIAFRKDLTLKEKTDSLTQLIKSLGYQHFCEALFENLLGLDNTLLRLMYCQLSKTLPFHISHDLENKIWATILNNQSNPPAFNPDSEEKESKTVTTLFLSSDVNELISLLDQKTQFNVDARKRLFDYCIAVGIADMKIGLLKTLHQKYFFLELFKVAKETDLTIMRLLIIDDIKYARLIYNHHTTHKHTGLPEFVSLWVELLIETENGKVLKDLYQELLKQKIDTLMMEKNTGQKNPIALEPDTEKKIWNTLVTENPANGGAMFSSLMHLNNRGNEVMLQCFAYWMSSINDRLEVIRIHASLKAVLTNFKIDKMIKAIADNRILELELAESKKSPSNTLEESKEVDKFLNASHSRFFKCGEPDQSSWEIHKLIKKHDTRAQGQYNELKDEAQALLNRELTKQEGRTTHFEFNR